MMFDDDYHTLMPAAATTTAFSAFRRFRPLPFSSPRRHVMRLIRHVRSAATPPVHAFLRAMLLYAAAACLSLMPLPPHIDLRFCRC